jgi:CBS domain-containing protein
VLLKEICTPDVVRCSPGTSVLGAARLMREHHVGDLVVIDDTDSDQVPLGMVTDRDIVVDVLAQERDPAALTVREIMHRPVVIASATEDASEAIERMKTHGVRRIPVMGENRRLAGIVCLDDLVKQLAADANALVDIIVREQGREHRGRR